MFSALSAVTDLVITRKSLESNGKTECIGVTNTGEIFNLCERAGPDEGSEDFRYFCNFFKTSMTSQNFLKNACTPKTVVRHSNKYAPIVSGVFCTAVVIMWIERHGENPQNQFIR